MNRDCLEPHRITRPDCRIAAVRVPRLHDLGKCLLISYRVQIAILIDLAEIGVVVLDCFSEQLERSFRKLTTLRLVRAGNGS